MKKAKPMSVSLRDRILATKALPKKVVPVEVPEWGLTVYVRCMTGLERDRFELAQRKDHGDIRPRLFASTTCDENGVALFSEADFADLRDLDANAMDRIIMAAMALNDVSKEGIEKAGEA